MMSNNDGEEDDDDNDEDEDGGANGKVGTGAEGQKHTSVYFFG